MLARILSIRNSHILLVGTQDGTTTLKVSLAVSYKTKDTLTYDPEITHLGIFPNELKL